jgi:hypothetical protein
MSNKQQLQINNNKFASLISLLDTKAVGGGEQATPEISINASNGLITATAGSKASTYQLAFQTAKTITPTTTTQIAVSSGYYTGGNITVAGDANLVASNIKSGVSIFGVSGTYEGSGSGGSGEDPQTLIDSLFNRTITSYSNSTLTKVFVCAFQDCNSLVTISLPACTSIGISAFRNCVSLTEVSFPKCQTIDGNAFAACRNITSISFPECKKLNNYGFYGCSGLTSVTLPACLELGTHAFGYCRSMTSVTLPTCSKFAANAFVGCLKLMHLEIGFSSVATLSNVNAFTSTPMSLSTLTGSFGSIYVPASLVDAYKSATNWATYADRITAIVE